MLLARRSGTGFEDGRYGPVGGHLEPRETIVQAAVRECKEEIGVVLEPLALSVVGVPHYTSPTGEGVDFFLRATGWVGAPTAVAECDDLVWCFLTALPKNTAPFARRALEQHLVEHLVAGRWFDETGWTHP